MKSIVHPDWEPILARAWQTLDPAYREALQATSDWLPGPSALFAAFQRPLTEVRYVLFGESPYPRAASANGYAFWDAAVGELWSPTGLSTAVNRATSLRNWLKMLLHARGDLKTDFSQHAIARLDHSLYHPTADALFRAWIAKGFLLLNATLVYRKGEVAYHARQWRPFMITLLQTLKEVKPTLQLILLGRFAQSLPETHHFSSLIAEHPYQLSFITNPTVIQFFKPLALLDAYDRPYP